MGLGLETLWTILPLRGFADGKSRLAPVLDAAGRARLNRELLAHTLEVVTGWSRVPGRTIVVSPCPDVLAFAREAGATAVNEGLRALGQSGAVRLGEARAAALGATHVLALPCDLPRLSVGALRALTTLGRGGQYVILAPDRAGTGTNAVLVGVGTGFEFAFGPASLAAHQAAARRAGLTVLMARRGELEFDLDTPDDLARWRTPAGGARRAGVTPVKLPEVREEEE
jgi:2-phospho-L-lactate guanylyltransferase